MRTKSLWLCVILVTMVGLVTAITRPDRLSLSAQKSPIEVSNQELTPLQIAFRSTVRIYWDNIRGNVTTGTIVGRKPLLEEPGWYKYFVITALHGIKDEKPDGKTFLADLHHMPNDTDEPLLLAEEVSVVASVTDIDLMIISFDLDEELPMVLILRDELAKLKVGDTLYHIGCDDGGAPLIRMGALSLKRYSQPQDITSRSHFRREPKSYLTLGMDLWPGASGGGVYSKDGHYIGMVLAIAISQWNGNIIPHLSYGLKYPTIYESLKNKDIEYVLQHGR